MARLPAAPPRARRGGIVKVHYGATGLPATGLKVYDYLWVGEGGGQGDRPEERCFWTRHCRAILKHHREHPEGPHSYGWWDSVPGRPEARPTHAKWLARYLPMVEKGTWTWLDVSDSDLTVGALPPRLCLSAFANRELYLVLANYGRAEAVLETREAFLPHNGEAGPAGRRWILKGRSLTILRRV